jgi:dimethylargininase
MTTRTIALTRPVSPSIAEGLRTHLEREPMDVALAERQHEGYEALLVSSGCEVRRLPALPELPDAVFVEDQAVVLDELAIVARSGAESRRAEAASVEAALREWREVRTLSAPATLDGGDVLRIDRTLYVGRSERTNDHGIEQLSALAAPAGYRVVPVTVTGALHLKTAVTYAGAETIVINPRWIDASPFRQYDRIDVSASEPWGANVLRVGDAVLAGAAFPRTARELERRGFAVHRCDLSELAKAEGALTCCCLLVAV